MQRGDRTYSQFQEGAAALGTAVLQVSPPEHLNQEVMGRIRVLAKRNSPASLSRRTNGHAPNTE
jgi:hypothetical protein